MRSAHAELELEQGGDMQLFSVRLGLVFSGHLV